MENNPLKQYFRRPAVYLSLPSKGAGYPANALDIPENGEFPVYPMTAIDEITVRTPDALFNGNAITELIKSCIPNIKEPWHISSIDLDAILVAIKVASNNNDFSIESKCPACKEESTYGINLTGLLASMKPGDYDTELQVQDLYIKFKPLEFREMNEANLAQFELQKSLRSVLTMEDTKEREAKGEQLVKNITLLTMEILARSIAYIRTPSTIVTQNEFILEYIQSADRVTYNKIRDHATKLRSSTEIQPLDVKCTSCNHEYKQTFTLNLTDFFD